MRINEHLSEVERYSAVRSTNKPNLRLDMAERVINYPEEYFSDFLKTLSQEDFITYPSVAEYQDLIKRIEEFNRLPEGSVSLGTGSDTIIKQLFQLTSYKGSEIVTSNPSFPMYGVYASMHESKIKAVNYDKDLKVPMGDIKAAVNENTSMVVLANPNSPIGDYKHYDELRDLSKFLNDKGIVFLIDEAYCEYADVDDYSLISSLAFEYDNVVIARTFSKAWGAAGSRVGYSISDKKIQALLQNLRLTFPISGASLKYIKFLLENPRPVLEYISRVKEQRAVVKKELQESGFDVISGHVNWVHFNDTSDNTQALDILDSLGIAVKKNAKIPHDKRETWIRLTISPDAENSEFIRTVCNKQSEPMTAKGILQKARDSSILNGGYSTSLRDWMPEVILRSFSDKYSGKIFCDVGCGSGAIALSASIDARIAHGVEILEKDRILQICERYGTKIAGEAFEDILNYSEDQRTNFFLKFGSDCKHEVPWADFYVANVPNNSIIDVLRVIEKTNPEADILIAVPIKPGEENTREIRAKESWLNDSVRAFLTEKQFKIQLSASIFGYERLIAVSKNLEVPDMREWK